MMKHSHFLLSIMNCRRKTHAFHFFSFMMWAELVHCSKIATPERKTNKKLISRGRGGGEYFLVANRIFPDFSRKLRSYVRQRKNTAKRDVFLFYWKWFLNVKQITFRRVNRWKLLFKKNKKILNDIIRVGTGLDEFRRDRRWTNPNTWSPLTCPQKVIESKTEKRVPVGWGSNRTDKNQESCPGKNRLVCYPSQSRFSKVTRPCSSPPHFEREPLQVRTRCI